MKWCRRHRYSSKSEAGEAGCGRFFGDPPPPARTSGPVFPTPLIDPQANLPRAGPSDAPKCWNTTEWDACWVHRVHKAACGVCEVHGVAYAAAHGAHGGPWGPWGLPWGPGSTRSTRACSQLLRNPQILELDEDSGVNSWRPAKPAQRPWGSSFASALQGAPTSWHWRTQLHTWPARRRFASSGGALAAQASASYNNGEPRPENEQYPEAVNQTRDVDASCPRHGLGKDGPGAAKTTHAARVRAG